MISRPSTHFAVSTVAVLGLSLGLAACSSATEENPPTGAVNEESAEAEEAAQDEAEFGEVDLSAAEETTNNNGDTVYVIPQGETAKIFHWQHLYGITLTVDDATITEVLPDDVIIDEGSKTESDGTSQAAVTVTLANDGLHSEHYQGEGSLSASSTLQEFGLYADLERDSQPVAEHGGSAAYEGQWLVNREEGLDLKPGDTVSDLHLVFTLDNPSEDGTYYLTYRGYSDILYAWEIEIGS